MSSTDAASRTHTSSSTTPAGSSAPPASAIGEPGRAQAASLAAASRALWTATLSLMTAFMQTPAPAHRHLLARRIARNFDTLAGQDCFDADCRSRFARLADRWRANAARHAPEPAPRKTLLDAFF